MDDHTYTIVRDILGLLMLLGTIAKLWITSRQVDKAVDDIHRVEKATNSMKDALVAKTEEEGVARGGMEERARADARDAESGKPKAAKIIPVVEEIKKVIKDIPEQIKKEVPSLTADEVVKRLNE